MLTEQFSAEIQLINYVSPFLDGVDRDRKLSKNFTLGEFYDATFLLADEWTGVYTIPVHKNAIEVAQLVRDFLKSPVTPTSIFRSVGHDKKQGRIGNSQHTKAFAIDLKGEEISKRLRVAIETKNTFHRGCRIFSRN